MHRFFSKNGEILLALFFTNPGKAFYMQEIGQIIGKKPGVFQKAINALEEEGILQSTYQANARFFKVNANYPLYKELKKMIDKTAGITEKLRAALKKIDEVQCAILYGSFAKHTERSDSDVDLLIIGRKGVEKVLLNVVRKMERGFQREINYKIYSSSEFSDKWEKGDAFLEEVMNNRYIILKGDPNAL